MKRAFLLVMLCASAAEAYDVRSSTSRQHNLLEYVDSRRDLSRTVRAQWHDAVRLQFGGKALKDGSDEGVTVAKSVIAAAIFFGVDPKGGARAAYEAYHDTYRWVPPPIAINYQILSFKGRRPASSARQMAFDFPKHFNEEIAPQLVRWWEEALEQDRIPKEERARVEELLRQTRARMPQAQQPSTTKKVRWDPRLQTELVSAVESWLGTPYRWGGTDKRGVDCSGFVRAIYRRAFDTEIPRTARKQAALGRKVAQDALRPGDLIFFDTLDRGHITHVGVYLGDGQFAHASSTRGVTRARLGLAYYQRAYVTSRRIIEHSSS